MDAYTQVELGDLEDQTASSSLDTSFISNQSDDLFDDETPYDQEEEQDDDYFFTSSTDRLCRSQCPRKHRDKVYYLQILYRILRKYCPDCEDAIT